VVIRRDIYEKHPCVAQSLYRAFVRAQRETYQDLYEAAALKYMLPWLLKRVEDTRSVMGDDFWPYGLGPNLYVLETFWRYSHEQGLSKRELKPRELFAPETFESFKI
jgi:4,5-dihydroxyphthalate decarboxylase